MMNRQMILSVSVELLACYADIWFVSQEDPGLEDGDDPKETPDATSLSAEVP